MSCDSTTIRAFVALPIPDAVKSEIERVQHELRCALPEKLVRWTKREQFHLTLSFLGNVEAGRVMELSDALRSACSGFRALQLCAERVGCFPDLRFPRVVWVWVHDTDEHLAALQGSIETAVAKFAETKGEKRFTGHVTIARLNGFKRPQTGVLARQVQAMTGRSFGEWAATEVNLMRSELLQSGAVHTVLAAFPLT